MRKTIDRTTGRTGRANRQAAGGRQAGTRDGRTRDVKRALDDAVEKAGEALEDLRRKTARS